MARPRHDPSAVDTRERVLRAAERAFGDKGYAAATLAEIARGAGIRRPSLLYHFGSKEQLYEAVLERAFGQLNADLGLAMGTAAPPEVRLRALTRAYRAHLEAHPWLPRLVLREMLDQQGGGHDLLVARLVPLADLVAAYLAEVCAGALRPGVDVRSAVVSLGSTELLRVAAGELGTALWTRPERLGDQAVDLLLA